MGQRRRAQKYDDFGDSAFGLITKCKEIAPVGALRLERLVRSR